ncbi:MAG TPA: type IV pilus biogenesis/stability protein PilW [Tahibacter sp.]|nr:type IV pilus biogenesis/stability protein PilW [Tahibacter sp.]
MPRKFAPIAILLLLLLGGCATAAPRSNPESAGRKAAEINVALAQGYMRQNKLEIALEKLQKALEQDSNYADAHTVIAVLYERINRPQLAEEHYRRAAQLQPKLGMVNNNYGAFLCRTGRYDEADKYFVRALDDPFYQTRDVALTNAGTCQLQANRVDEAEKDFREALTANANNPEALYQLARLLFGKSDFLRARAFLQRFDSLGQANPDALLLGHNIESKLGNAREAGEYARRLKTEFPDSDQTRQLESSTPS